MAGIQMNGFPSQGSAMDPKDHPANTVPDATEHHWGTVASTADAATRGYLKSPMQEPMPVSPTGEIPFK